MVPQGWTLPSELDKIPGYMAAWEKRPSWENTYYTVSDALAEALLSRVFCAYWCFQKCRLA